MFFINLELWVFSRVTGSRPEAGVEPDGCSFLVSRALVFLFFGSQVRPRPSAKVNSQSVARRRRLNHAWLEWRMLFSIYKRRLDLYFVGICSMSVKKNTTNISFIFVVFYSYFNVYYFGRFQTLKLNFGSLPNVIHWLKILHRKSMWHMLVILCS